MEFDRTGVVLYTLQYEACIHFYNNVLGLKSMFETESLTCFEFGASYLMVEKDESSTVSNDQVFERVKTCLRMNVPDVKKLAHLLEQQQVKVDYQEHSWGTVAKFFDPDGNLLAFKDSQKFERQIEEGLKSQ